ncbi:FtsX-like permease family protein [Pseudoalteromonas sp. SR44-5]|uniref:FtsX-like permease family protein n=2 Tax=Pseudoalteromonas TaxID=53246 RepID=UPI0015FF499A|nr:FtsX-like permease family protein [Pseudoalteromonas sp. SR44-5]MBB1367713.1 FtsX-like permease family protein [Pseudoalteromonas sp. SR44-5]
MFSLSFITTIRSFAQHKLHFSLSVMGLSLGMAIVILMGLFIRNELSFERNQPNVNNHYRLVMHAQENNNEYILTTPRAYQQLANIAGVDDVFYVFKTQMASDDKVLVGQNAFQLLANVAVTPNITQLVNINVLAGNLQDALNAPEKIALSRSEVLRLFGSDIDSKKRVNTTDFKNIIGKTIRLQHNNRLITVAAVFEDLPINSHFYFESLMSFAPYQHIGGNVAHTYVALSAGADKGKIAAQVTEVFNQIWQWKNIYYRLQAIEDIHLGPNFAQDMKVGGAMSSVMICALMSGLLLLISCVNYVNFTVAQAANRAKEVGVKKALGASKRQLITQFMGESVLLAWLALVVACVFVELAFPFFNQLIGRPIAFNGWHDVIWPVMGLATVVGVLSGIYPSFYMANFNAKAILSGAFKQGRQGVWIRKSLLLVQITLSISLLIGAITLAKQLAFLQSLPVNYGKSQQLVIDDMPASTLYGEQQFAFFDALQQIPEVIASTAMDFDITQSTNAGIFIEDKLDPSNPLSMSLAGVSGNVVAALDLQLVAGRDFSIEHASDWYSKETNQASIILPESALSVLGFKDAQSAVSQQVTFAAGPVSRATGVIVGVVKDIKVGPVNYQGAPVVFVCGLGIGGRYSLVVKVAEPSAHSTQKALAEFIRARLNIAPVAISYLEDNYQALYQEQQRLAEVVQIGSLISMALILIGVFGLTGFIVKQRQKEVAVRKVLGASRISIVNALAKEFLVLTFFGCLIAWPVSYFTLADWLSGFHEHIIQSIWVYSLAAVAVAAITWLTVASLAFKVASTRPSLTLRYE